MLLGRGECAARLEKLGSRSLGLVKSGGARRLQPLALAHRRMCSAASLTRAASVSESSRFIVFSPVLWDVEASARSANERSTPARSRARASQFVTSLEMSIAIWLACCARC